MIKGIIFDFGYTLYDPNSKLLYPSTKETLEALFGKYKLAVASRTEDVEKRRQEIRLLELEKFFDVIEVIQDGGEKDLKPILTKFGLVPEEVLVVGDRLTSELTQGKKLGMKTCRYLNGPEMDRTPQTEFEKTDFIIKDLKEIHGYLN